MNVLRGNDRAQWERDLPVYDEVRYRDLYPGVGMTVHERGGALEYDVCLEPFADPQRLVMQVDGASRLRLDPDGALVIETDAGMIRQDRPLTYEITPSGERLLVDSSFRLLDSFRFGFEVRGRDPSRALVIDPQLAYSTYLGGTGDDQGMGIAVDAAGAIYVAGYTFSSDLPTSAGAFDRSFGGSIDAFVVKLHPAGGGASDLDYATFLGGSADDIATDIAVDGSGTAWIIGNTQSSGFPTTPGAYDPVLTDTQETFVTALTAAGDGLVYSTLFRGTEGSGIALFGDLYLSGRIYGPGLPVTPNAFDATFDGPTDGYLAQLHPAGQGASDLRYATYLGGSGHDGVAKLAVRDGQIYAAGLTTATNFPVTSTAFDTSANGDYDGFVARLNPAGGGASDLVYSTYLGGASYDHVAAIAVDASGSVYVTGRTDSSDFPTRSALDATGNGIDAFVAKLTLDPAGSGGEDLVSSTYFGGSARDWGTGIALTPVGTICLAGFTDSADFPVVNAYDPSFHGGFDAYLATFDPALSQLLSSTYFGGN
ncbi:MAG: SBBP repeat-containing protein, partial [Planctomycetota bacterium]